LSNALRVARQTRALEIGTDIIQEIPRLFHQHFGERTAIIVADLNTFEVAGRAVQWAFQKAALPTLEPFIYRSPDLYAETRFVLDLENSLQDHEAIPIAVGSGTINDLTKLAAHRTGRPYLCLATAASMDGYAAFGASITHEGSKQTFECPAPAVVVADLKVIASAPAGMAGWGYADLLAKVTAGADWIVADALGVEPIDPLAWNIVQGRLLEALADPSGIQAASPAALGRLIEGLMLGGFAMQLTSSSRPASGAEHQFSHLWDMQHHTHQGQAPSHGSKVGIATLAVTALYERILELPLDHIDVDACVAQWPVKEAWIERARQHCGEGELGIVARREIAAKQSSTDELRTQLARLAATWLKLQTRLRQQLIPFDRLKEMLRAAGAPTEPEQIGISRERLRASFWQAFFIRRRFTVLDLAVRAGVFDRCLEEIFSLNGAWPATSGITQSSPQQPNGT
jgi:glycerol-1-phosphate dehydrogenase [NAD(P)+]